MRSWSVANATDYQPNWGTLNFKNSCLHPHSEIGYYNDSAWDPQKSFAAVWQASLPQFSALEVLQHWTNFYFSFTDCILTMLDPGAGGGYSSWTLEPGGGYSTENGVQLCAALKTLLSRPPDPSLKPPFQNFFSSSRSYICLKSQISGKFAFQRLKITKQTFTLASLIVSYHVGPWSPGGYSAENGYSYVPPLRPLFHALLTLP